jgi:cell division protein FtsI/penicillin-binding protein 2
VLALLTAVALATVGRAFQVMIVKHDAYLATAQAQQHTLLSIPSLRGAIRTSDGYTLAQSIRRTRITVDTDALRAPSAFATVAAATIGGTPDDVLATLDRQQRFVTLADRSELHTAEALRSLVPNAIILLPSSERLYPLGTLAAAVVGFVGNEGTEVVGRWGLEAAFDDELRGQPDLYRALRDAVQRNLAPERVRTGRPGQDLDLTLNAKIQAVCETELTATIADSGARSGSAVVLDPFTGDILALASVPSFDPARPAANPRVDWRLRPVVDALEPGSTIKPFVAALALAAGAVHPGEQFDCTRHGSVVAGRWIADHVRPGVYSLGESVAESANAAMIEIAERLEPDELLSGMLAFGFDRPTGIAFPGESPGMVPPTHRWSALSRASLAIGQELTVSPTQLAVAYAALANGGFLLTPRLVQQPSAAPHVRSRALAPDLAVEIRQMLQAVVTHGTGVRAAVPGYDVAGKTGTAQRAVDGSYENQEHIAWFAGFLPADTPRAVIVVALRNPTDDFWGASVAAPCFARIAAATMALLDIPPDSDPNVRCALAPLQAPPEELS